MITERQQLGQFREAVMITIAGTLISVVLFVWTIQSELKDLRARFDVISEAHLDNVERALSFHGDDLKLVANFFRASREVTQEEFTLFTDSILHQQHTRFIAWLPNGTETQTPLANGQHKPPLSREALRAYSYEPSQKSPFKMVSNAKNSLSMMLRVEKAPDLSGVIVAQLDLGKIAQSLERSAVSESVALSIYLTSQPNNPVFSEHDEIQPPVYRELEQHPLSYDVIKRISPDSNENIINIAGEDLILLATPKTQHFLGSASRDAWIILCLGIFGTTVIAFSAFRMANESTRIQHRVEQKTKALRDIEERYDLSVRGASVGLWDWQIVSGELYWSDRFKEIIGIDDPQFSPSFAEFERRLHPEDREKTLNAVQQHLEQKHIYAVDYRLRHNRGHYVRIHARGQAVWDEHGTPLRMSGSVDDISEAVASQAALRDSQAFLQLIFDKTPDLFFVKNERFELVQANTAFLSLYPPEVRDSVIGTTTLEAYDPAEVEVFLEEDKKAFRDGVAETLERITFPNGEVRLVYTTKTRFHNERGDAFILGLSHDVTEREQMIERLSRSNEELERFAYVCSHDLQEPLRMVTSFSGKLNTALADHLRGEEKAQRYLNFVTDGAQRAQALIADILDYSRVERSVESFEEVDLNHLLEKIKYTLQDSEESRQTLDNSITHDKLPTVRGNKTQLYQLLQNLLTNGLKYQVDSALARVHLSAELKGEQWEIHVIDNGIGIDAKHFTKIFDIFRRLHRRDEYAGTGIGLALCKKIVENHAGRIWVESTPGQGSTFIFTLPKPKDERAVNDN